ncbi:UDP-N-acetylmuramoyl-tripeptide--D-alanyl-D-alanine ligase [Nocardioides campestrisoli]|uniref:UDP-N-acetylmuramoyl-tripeptide--D-alanyl-D- alanine ligase n=1 Tax=Nocardioides campestrisoli TaxID=2736757 RepID=UPI001C62918B|nr:UDP-N-acetylmuramoyl-tripeptide--D-alanyl-D-alanine ligase [Nocardioides campestrisoli]
MTLNALADLLGGRVVGPGDLDPDRVEVVAEATLDSRAVVPGGLFVALAGERTDGHEHVQAALSAGAVAYLGSRDVGAPGVVVPDVVAALGRLGRHVVDSLPGLTVLALTGSQGKTGTKDYLAHVLAGEGPTVATLGNYNNELGVPLTVLRATEETRFLVVEMGARGIGHVAELCRTAPPQVAAVLNVGTSHLGEFGSRAAIAQGKGEIVEALPPSGTAVLNADDALVRAMAPRTRARVLTFGADGDVTLRALASDDLGRRSFELGAEGRWYPVRLAQLGSHQVPNALAAAAMALAVGVPADRVASRLTTAEPASRWRMELHERADGLLVINDSYNANPESMEAALDTLGHIGRAGGRRTVAVLGEMRELGDDSAAQHCRVGAAAAAAQVDVLVTVGTAAAEIAACATRDPAWRGTAVIIDTRDEALQWVRENVSAADAVLVKASRGAALEHIADGLLEEGDPAR